MIRAHISDFQLRKNDCERGQKGRGNFRVEILDNLTGHLW